jgi:hypothetical protein
MCHYIVIVPISVSSNFSIDIFNSLSSIPELLLVCIVIYFGLFENFVKRLKTLLNLYLYYFIITVIYFSSLSRQDL